jgi:hypothetical protein
VWFLAEVIMEYTKIRKASDFAINARCKHKRDYLTVPTKNQWMGLLGGGCD